jgi:hypothetical protein
MVDYFKRVFQGRRVILSPSKRLEIFRQGVVERSVLRVEVEFDRDLLLANLPGGSTARKCRARHLDND